MKFLVKSENAYTLVTTLLIIVVFMIFVLFFMQYSINTANHSTAVEQEIQSTDLAEMGVELFKVAIENEYSRIINDTPTPNEFIDEEEFEKEKEKYISSVHSQIKSKFTGDSDLSLLLHEPSHLSDDELRYEISDLSVSEIERNKIKITFVSHGIANGEKQTDISASISFDYDSIFIGRKISAPDGSNGEEQGISLPEFDNFNNCERLLDFRNKNCSFYGNLEYKNNENNDLKFEETQIYVKGKFDLPNLIGLDFKETSFYVDGDFESQNLNGTENLSIYATGNVTIGNNIQGGAKNVLICAGKEVSVKNSSSGVEIYTFNKNPDEFKKGGACELMGSGSNSDSLIQLDGDRDSPIIIEEVYDY